MVIHLCIYSVHEVFNWNLLFSVLLSDVDYSSETAGDTMESKI